MNIKKNFLSIGVLLALILFISYQGWTQTKPEPKAPIITNTYAVEKGHYGYIWRIYIEADDPDGDMQRIASVVDQPGQGRYPTDWIYLKPGYQKHFKGYIQWNTFSSKASYMSEWTQITLKVSILDKSGNESNVIVFPFTFESGTGPEPKPPAPFDQGDNRRLGHIMIDLRGLDQGDGDERILD